MADPETPPLLRLEHGSGPVSPRFAHSLRLTIHDDGRVDVDSRGGAVGTFAGVLTVPRAKVDALLERIRALALVDEEPTRREGIEWCSVAFDGKTFRYPSSAVRDAASPPAEAIAAIVAFVVDAR